MGKIWTLESGLDQRGIEANPETPINGVVKDYTYDASARGIGLTMSGQFAPFYSAYMILGTNNWSFNSGGGRTTGSTGTDKKLSLFFVDMYNEFAIVSRKNFYIEKRNNFDLHVGTDLHSWNGVSRLTHANSPRTIPADFPTYNYLTVEIGDQFSRQLGRFVHGQYNGLNYRFDINKSFQTDRIPTLGGIEAGFICKKYGPYSAEKRYFSVTRREGLQGRYQGGIADG